MSRRILFVVVAVLFAVAGVYGYGVQEYSREMYVSRMYPFRYNDDGSVHVFDNFFQDVSPSELDVALVWESGFSFSNAELCLSVIDYRTPYTSPGSYASRGGLEAGLYQYGALDIRIDHSAEECPFEDADTHEVCRLAKVAFNHWSSQRVEKASWLFRPSDGLMALLPASSGVACVPSHEFFSVPESVLPGVHVGQCEGDFYTYPSWIFVRWYCVEGMFYPVYGIPLDFSFPDEMLSGEVYTSHEMSFLLPPGVSGVREVSYYLETMGLPPDTSLRWTADSLPGGVLLVGADGSLSASYLVR